MASDARLVTLVRQGWPAAFEAVYNRHHRGILSFCRHVLSDPDEAEDAVQHTFLAAYNDLIGSDKPIHLRAWLFTIARNRCYSILRARREQPAADLAEPVTEGLATQVQRRQDLRDLVIDLHSLPDEQRAALVLAELDALSHEEIGEALGVPREKVKALVFQARESLVASRTARETACADIREQLSTSRGGGLRRANLRRHLRDCSGCRDFRRHVERQRRQIAALLPVVPTLALKETVLTGTSAAGFGGGGLIASSAMKSGLLKGFATLMLATAGTAGTYVATHDFHSRRSFAPPARPRPQPAAVSTAGLQPTHHRPGASSIERARPAAAVELRHTGAIRATGLTTLGRLRNGVLNPFGPLVHNRAAFPRQTQLKVETIAPPHSTGKVPTTPTPTPPAVPSIPSATIPSTPPVVGNPKPVTKPTTQGDTSAANPGTAGYPRSVGSSRGATVRTGRRGGRALSGGTVPARGTLGRAVGRPAARGYSSRGVGVGSPARNGSESSGSRLVGGRPRGVAGGDSAVRGSGGSITTTGSAPAPNNGQLPGTTTTTTTTNPGSAGTSGNGGNPSGGLAGRGGTSAIPS